MKNQSFTSATFSWLPSELEPIALRLARADECAFEIGDAISLWSMEGPLEFEQVRRGIESKTILKSIRPVPPRASLLFSEAINHLRAAMDNVVWHLVEKEHGPLEGILATQVVMPIQPSPERMKAWTQRRVKGGLDAFSSESSLGQRLNTVQQFVDVNSSVPSLGRRLAALIGQEVELAHPLHLLQQYSNADKHRSIRLAASRTFVSDDASPLMDQNLSHQDLRVGDVLGHTVWGEPVILETNTAVMVQRPDPFSAWVNPVKELNALRKHVSETVIPVLLTGLQLPGGLPSTLDLQDNGKSIRERLSMGNWEDAEKRLGPVLKTRFEEAVNRDVEFPNVVDAPPEDIVL